MASSPQGRIDFGIAVADELRRRYPFKTANHVAADLKCTFKAAENLLQGHLSRKSITALIRVYGLGLVIDSGAAVAGTTLHKYIIEQADRAREEQARARAVESEFEHLAQLEAGRVASLVVDESGVRASP